MAAIRRSETVLEEVPLEDIEVNPDQPRKTFDENEIKALADTIQKHGLLNPLTVARSGGSSKYILVSGERRLRALRLLDKRSAPICIVDGDISIISLIENIQRQDLHPIEEAEACQNVMSSNGWTQNRLAEELGKKRSTLANLLKLNKLPDKIKKESKSFQWASKSLLQEVASQTTVEAMNIMWNSIKEEKHAPTIESIRHGSSVRRSRPRPAKMIKSGHRFLKWLESIDHGEIADSQEISDEMKRIKREIDKLYCELFTE